MQQIQQKMTESPSSSNQENRDQVELSCNLNFNKTLKELIGEYQKAPSVQKTHTDLVSLASVTLLPQSHTHLALYTLTI